MDNGGLNLEVCEKLNEEEEENFILGKCFIILNVIKQDILIICTAGQNGIRILSF